MPLPPNKREIEKTFNFVLDELVRHLDLSNDIESVSQIIQEDGWLYELPFPNGSKRIIGKTAYQKLASLSQAIVESDVKLLDRIDPNLFLEVLLGELGRAIWEQEKVEERKFVESCVELVILKYVKSLEFYIPCIAPFYDGMKIFTIGPITFHDKEHFLANHAARVAGTAAVDLEEFKASYRFQNWIAHIRIDGFDRENAEKRAFLCVRLAIASIKARLDLSLAQWLGTEKQSMPGLTRYLLTSEPNGPHARKISLGWGRKFILNASNDQVEHLLSESSRNWFQVFGAFLEEIACRTGWSYIDSKIVTALIWLDIGNIPISDAERVVAFSNCLEAIFITRDRGKRQQLTARSRLLLEYSGWQAELNGKVEEFYAIRGDIVHGDIMPLSSDLSRAAHIGKYLTDVCVEGFIHFSHWLLTKHYRAGTKEHERPFNGHGSFDRAMEQELPLFIGELKERYPNP